MFICSKRLLTGDSVSVDSVPGLSSAVLFLRTRPVPVPVGGVGRPGPATCG